MARQSMDGVKDASEWDLAGRRAAPPRMMTLISRGRATKEISIAARVIVSGSQSVEQQRKSPVGILSLMCECVRDRDPRRERERERERERQSQATKME